MTLIGFDAIQFAEQEGLTLNKIADHIDGPAGRERISASAF